MRIIGWTVPILLVVVHWALAFALHPLLPDQVPEHFDIDGRPDRYGGPGVIFILPGVTTFVAAVMLGAAALTAWMARNHPGLVNVPRKSEFLQLSKEARVRVLLPVIAFLHLDAALTALLLVFLTFETKAVTLAEQESLSAWPVLLLVLSVLLGVVPTYRAVKRRIAREAADLARSQGDAAAPNVRA